MATIKKESNGLWSFRASSGGRGNRKQQYKAGFKTKREATIAAAEVEERLDSGLASKAATLPEYFDYWMNAFKIGRYSPVTDEWYEVVSGYAHEWFDAQHPGLPVSAVDRPTYQAFLDWCAEHPRKRGNQPLSRSTVARVNSYMRSMIKDAIEDGYAVNDFTRRAIIGGASGKAESEKYLNVADFKRVIALANAHAALNRMSNYVVLFMAMTGARFEEAVGLSWDDLDFNAGTVTFRRTWIYKKRKQHDAFAPLKNKSSYRTIPISSKLQEKLIRLHLQQQKQFLADGWRDPENLVFRNAEHRVCGNEAVNATVKRLCEEAHTKNVITSHGLRHSHGSLLLYEGVELMSISRRLGHGSLAITMRVYMHEVDELRQKDDAKALRALNSL